MESAENPARFLDAAGRVASWPAKRAAQHAVLRYLAAGLDFGRYYTEKEINGYLESRHTFGDYFLLRRGLIDMGLLRRRTDGSRYWRGDILPDRADRGALSLRRIRPADRAAVERIQRLCADYCRYAGRDFGPRDVADVIDGALPPVGHPEFFHACLIADGPAEPAGYAAWYLGYPDSRCLYIASLFLIPECRRRGIGAAVVRELACAARAAGIDTLRAGVMTENIPGLSFWVRQGFTGIAGIRPFEDSGKYALSLYRRPAVQAPAADSNGETYTMNF